MLQFSHMQLYIPRKQYKMIPKIQLFFSQLFKKKGCNRKKKKLEYQQIKYFLLFLGYKLWYLHLGPNHECNFHFKRKKQRGIKVPTSPTFSTWIRHRKIKSKFNYTASSEVALDTFPLTAITLFVSWVPRCEMLFISVVDSGYLTQKTISKNVGFTL